MNVLKKHLRNKELPRTAAGTRVRTWASRIAFTGLPCVYENKAGAPDYDEACH
jgi:hypothetical protein